MLFFDFKFVSEPALGKSSLPKASLRSRVLLDLFIFAAALSKGLNFSPPCVAYGVLTRSSMGGSILNFLRGSALPVDGLGPSAVVGTGFRGGGSGATVGLSRCVEYAPLGAGGSSPPGVFGMKPFRLAPFVL